MSFLSRRARILVLREIYLSALFFSDLKFILAFVALCIQNALVVAAIVGGSVKLGKSTMLSELDL